MEPYLQPTWEVIYYHGVTGEKQRIIAASESRQEAISEASQKVRGAGPWYFENAIHRIV
jgi:hypothetical protein